ncbi:zinc finger protein [Crotalus adamanteus]|uniref:Zinc finger protein n=1 Tax=Crotalus adamanteus TaxID=8729 RepID=A0AAW1BTZ6_CROAD
MLESNENATSVGDWQDTESYEESPMESSETTSPEAGKETFQNEKDPPKPSKSEKCSSPFRDADIHDLLEGGLVRLLLSYLEPGKARKFLPGSETRVLSSFTQATDEGQVEKQVPEALTEMVSTQTKEREDVSTSSQEQLFGKMSEEDPTQVTSQWNGKALVVIPETSPVCDEAETASPSQGSVSFEEVAVYFVEEEWEILDSNQKALHREVMLENSQNVTALAACEQETENDKEERVALLPAAQNEADKETFANQEESNGQEKTCEINGRPTSDPSGGAEDHVTTSEECGEGVAVGVGGQTEIDP